MNLEWDDAQWFDLDMIFSDIFKKEINNGDDVCIKSIMSHDKHFFYEQDVIDIYNLWQNYEEINWNEIDSDFKYSYISACYYWTKIPQKFIRKQIIIDCLMINEQIDLFYYLGMEMFGERTYCGSSFYQFEDCVSIVCAKSQEDLPLIFFQNFNKLKSTSIISDIEHLAEFFQSGTIIVKF